VAGIARAQEAKMPNSEAGEEPFLGRLQHVAVNSWNVGIKNVHVQKRAA